MPRADRIIGGMFGLAEPVAEPPGRPLPAFLRERSLFLVNGTSALALLIRELRPKRVWLPSYTCAALTAAVRHAGSVAHFYGVDRNLAPLPSWLSEVHKGDIVIIVRYFGFPTSSEHADAVRARGALVVEDAAQALFAEEMAEWADAMLLSPRKFLGVPDGGILLFKKSLSFGHVSLQPPPEQWWLRALDASLSRREFDRHGGEHQWFDLFRVVESEAPVGNFRMSELSRTLLLHCVDYEEIRSRRKANYDFLAEALPDVALFPNRPAEVVPLGFPVLVQDRDEVRRALFEHEIYPPIHWPLEGVVPREFEQSHRMSAEIMTLPCDQRYDEGDMGRMVSALREATRSA